MTSGKPKPKPQPAAQAPKPQPAAQAPEPQPVARAPKPKRPAERAFDAWLERGLHEMFDKVAREPIPDELLKLIRDHNPS